MSVFLYGCQTWLLTEAIRTKLQVFINCCLRKIPRIFLPTMIANKNLLNRKLTAEILIMKFVGKSMAGSDTPYTKLPISNANKLCKKNRKAEVGKGGQRLPGITLCSRRSIHSRRSMHSNNITSLRTLAVCRSRWRPLNDSLRPS